MTDINSDVSAGVSATRVLTAEPWRPRTGAFTPRSAFPGTSVPGAGSPPSAAVRPVPRVRVRAILAVPVPQAAAMAQLGQTTNYNHMTSVFVTGEGASGPPPDREPA